MTGSSNPWWIGLAAVLVVMWTCTIRSGGDWTYLGWSIVYTVALVGAYELMWLADRIELQNPRRTQARLPAGPGESA